MIFLRKLIILMQILVFFCLIQKNKFHAKPGREIQADLENVDICSRRFSTHQELMGEIKVKFCLFGSHNIIPYEIHFLFRHSNLQGANKNICPSLQLLV